MVIWRSLSIYSQLMLRIDEQAIALAAVNGHLEIVKYLISIHAPINDRGT